MNSYERDSEPNEFQGLVKVHNSCDNIVQGVSLIDSQYTLFE